MRSMGKNLSSLRYDVVYFLMHAIISRETLEIIALHSDVNRKKKKNFKCFYYLRDYICYILIYYFTFLYSL